MRLRVMMLLLTSAVALAACSDPKQEAQNTVAKVKTSIADERKDLDPKRQLDAYDAMVKDLEGLAKDYSDTPAGRAIAAGNSVDGVSLASVRAARDALALRAPCYADPTPACLRPFSSHPDGPSAGNAGQSAAARAQTLVCDSGYPVAAKALAPIAINTQAYGDALIQVALAAAKCDKPNAVKAAVNDSLSMLPPGSARVQRLMSLLATADLKPAWPIASAALDHELSSGTLPSQDVANGTLALAMSYAEAGNVKAALAKYTYFTGTLHYRVDGPTQQKLVGLIMADGDVPAGLKLSDAGPNQNLVAVALHFGASTLGQRMGLTDAMGTVQTVANPTVAGYFDGISLDTAARSRAASAAAALEAAIDHCAATAQASAQTVGDIGLDSDYGVLALAWQKLGQPAKADAAIKKAAALRVRLLGRIDGSDYDNYARYRELLAVAQGDLTTAANLVATAPLSGDEYGHILMVEAGRTQDAEHVIALGNIIVRQRDMWHSYMDVIPVMAKAGKMSEIDKLIGAWAGNPAQKADFYWPIVDAMAARGDADGAKTFAEKHGLAADDRGKLHLDYVLLNSKEIVSDRDKVEPIIREMFEIGTRLDQTSGIGYVGGRDHMTAQNAAKLAFANGYFDLGTELYEKASSKDQRPLLAALMQKTPRDEVTKVLMLAQNNLSGDSLTYVVDAAVRALERKGA